MKILKLFLSTVITLFTLNAKAQDDANAGIFVDGVKAEKIDCWSFNEMDLVFPIRENFLKYDKIQLVLIMNNDENSNKFRTVFYLDFSGASFKDNFNGAKYGVWKFLTNKKTDAPIADRTQWRRKKFSKKDGFFLQIQLIGLIATGQYQYDSYGNRMPVFGNGAFLYKSEMIPIVKSEYDENTSCTVSGTQKDIKIEKSPAYQDKFGIIK